MAGAGGAIIGALRVVLGADTAEFEKGLKSAQASLSSFGAGAGKAFATAGAAMSVAAIGLGVAIKSTVNEADKLGKMSQKIGVPVEELSALRYAASLADVSLEALGKGLGKLSKAMVEAAAKPMSEAANAFRALGVSVVDSDGRLKSSSEVMSDVAEKFAGLKDGAGKTAVSMALFGKAGAELIPLLNEGKSGIERLKDEAARFGIVIGTQAAKDAEVFNDNLKKLGFIWDGLVLKLTGEMLPGLKNLSATMVIAANDSNLMKGAANLLIGAFQGLVNVGLTTSLMLTRFAAEWKAFREFMQTDIFSGKLGENWAKFNAVGAESTRQLEALRYTLETAGLKDAFGDIATGTDKATTSQKDFNYAAMGGKNAIDQFLDSIKKRTASMQAEAQTIGKSSFETERLRINLEGLSIATAKNIPHTAALKSQIDAVAVSYATMNEKAQFGKQLFEQTRTPVEQFGIAMERLNNAMQRGAIDADTYARGVAQAQQTLTQADPIARGFGQSLETAFDRAIQSGSKLSDVLRTLLQDLARMMANQAFRTLLYGSAGGASGGILGTLFSGLFGSAFSGGGGAVAAGNAAVGSSGIGFASGGSIMPGGSGGIDSQLVQFWKSPKEQVNIGTPDQLNGSGGGGTMHLTVVVQGSGDKELMARMETGTRRVVGEALHQYDRGMPDRIAGINRDPRRRG